MKQITMTDLELQKLVGEALRARLRKEGFVPGSASDEHNGFYFPVSLELAGDVKVTRFADGTWTFEQETNQMLAERIASSLVSHVEAVTEAIQKYGS